MALWHTRAVERRVNHCTWLFISSGNVLRQWIRLLPLSQCSQLVEYSSRFYHMFYFSIHFHYFQQLFSMVVIPNHWIVATWANCCLIYRVKFAVQIVAVLLRQKLVYNTLMCRENHQFLDIMYQKIASGFALCTKFTLLHLCMCCSLVQV